MSWLGNPENKYRKLQHQKLFLAETTFRDLQLTELNTGLQKKWGAQVKISKKTT